MIPTISITQSQLLTALRTFLLGIYDGEVIQAQANRVAMPTGNFCEMTPLFLTGLSMSSSTYTDPGTGLGTDNNQRSTQWNVQLDFYGPTAADSCAIAAGLIRTPYACEQLADSGMQPLYASEPKQTTMLNAEQQFNLRWTVDFVANFTPVISTPQDFANTVVVVPAEVDATFPPS